MNSVRVSFTLGRISKLLTENLNHIVENVAVPPQTSLNPRVAQFC